MPGLHKHESPAHRISKRADQFDARQRRVQRSSPLVRCLNQRAAWLIIHSCLLSKSNVGVDSWKTDKTTIRRSSGRTGAPLGSLPQPTS